MPAPPVDPALLLCSGPQDAAEDPAAAPLRPVDRYRPSVVQVRKVAGVVDASAWAVVHVVPQRFHPPNAEEFT
ncbi:hypothetical protein StrepF001_11735 [Streptomyces sp. F001]|nr:hypothetical protein StrepF001_11735 [Streptomyces sp. F001]